MGVEGRFRSFLCSFFGALLELFLFFRGGRQPVPGFS